MGDCVVGTLELHQSGLGSVGGAAASICAGATVARLVGQNTGAVLMLKVNSFVAPHNPLASACLLGEEEILM